MEAYDWRDLVRRPFYVRESPAMATVMRMLDVANDDPCVPAKVVVDGLIDDQTPFVLAWMKQMVRDLNARPGVSLN